MEVEHLQAGIEEDVGKRNVYTYNRRKAECSTLHKASLPAVRRTHEGCLLEDSDGQLFYGCKHKFLMQVRRKIMNQIKGQPRLQKALALALFLKWKFGRSSCMQNYTINKIHSLTGVSATTLKKYLPILKEMGWVHFEGKNNQHIVITKLCSHNEERNIKVNKFCHKTFKDTYYSLRAFLALIIQSHKDFIKRTLQRVSDPKGAKEYRCARKLVKRLVRQGVLCDRYDKYKEYGLSLKRIAKETGNCIRTAFNTMQYAIKHGWTTKKHNFEQTCAPKIYFMNVHGYTFATKNNLYKVYANTYTLNKGVSGDLGLVNIRW